MSATTNSTATAGIDRRTLLTGAAVASAAVASGFLAHKPTPALAADEVTFDEECDVLVIGSGYSGMAAAYEAGQAGANVKIVEKLGVTGGNSMVADGDFAVCMSDGQKAMGIEDSVDAYVYDMQVAGLFLNDVEKCRVIAEKSNETWEWTRDVLGTEWQIERGDRRGRAHPLRRPHHPAHAAPRDRPRRLDHHAAAGEALRDGHRDPDQHDARQPREGRERPRGGRRAAHRLLRQRPHLGRAALREGPARRGPGLGRLRPRRRLARGPRPASRRGGRLHQRRRRDRREPLHRHGLRRPDRAPRLDPVRPLVQPRRGGLRRRPDLDRLRRRLRPEHQPADRRALRRRAHRPQALLRRDLRGGRAAASRSRATPTCPTGAAPTSRSASRPA